MKKYIGGLYLLLLASNIQAQDSVMMRRIANQVMLHGQCYEDLRDLCKNVGHRLSGTPAAAKAVNWASETLQEAGADKVWLQPVDVPKWIRGKEQLKIQMGDKTSYVEIPMLSIGNTVGTDGRLLEGTVIMVNTLAEFKKLDKKQVKGKIVFFNYRFRQDLVNCFEGYRDAGPYRWSAPNAASAKGAVGVIIRSLSTGADDVPHTGSMRYADTIKPIPAVAIGNMSADKLEAAFKDGKAVHAQLRSECRMAGTVRSYNVIGEIRGSQHPERIVLVGGHLDSWDVGEGAHDDGAGCVQSIEVIRTFKALGIRPKNTIRAVLFMNEENGLKGGHAYADSAAAKNEQHILAIESDAGGFSPRGIGLDMDAGRAEQVRTYKYLFLPYGVYDFAQERSGSDIGPLSDKGVPCAGLIPDPQRYFDFHHTNADVFEAVNHRELKLGAVTLAGLVYLVSEYGLK